MIGGHLLKRITPEIAFNTIDQLMSLKNNYLNITNSNHIKKLISYLESYAGNNFGLIMHCIDHLRPINLKNRPVIFAMISKILNNSPSFLFEPKLIIKKLAQLKLVDINNPIELLRKMSQNRDKKTSHSLFDFKLFNGLALQNIETNNSLVFIPSQFNHDVHDPNSLEYHIDIQKELFLPNSVHCELINSNLNYSTPMDKFNLLKDLDPLTNENHSRFTMEINENITNAYKDQEVIYFVSETLTVDQYINFRLVIYKQNEHISC